MKEDHRSIYATFAVANRRPEKNLDSARPIKLKSQLGADCWIGLL